MTSKLVTSPKQGSLWDVLSDTGAEYTVRTDVNGWARVKDHPRHAEPSKRTLSKPHWKFVRRATGAAKEQLKWVVAAELDGEVYKVDGHSRAVLWVRRELPEPNGVFVLIYRCKTYEDLNAIYAAYDNQSAAETLYEKVQGAYHENGLQLKSKRLRTGAIVDALHIALSGEVRTSGHDNNFDVYEAVGFYAKELQLLDTAGPQPELFHTGVVSAALIALKESPNNLSFFQKLADNAGAKQNGLMDPVENIRTYISKLKDTRSAWVRANQLDLCAKTLVAVDLWVAGEEQLGYWSKKSPKAKTFKNRIRTTD